MLEIEQPVSDEVASDAVDGLDSMDSFEAPADETPDLEIETTAITDDDFGGDDLITQADMPAYNYEYELATSEGIQFEWLASPIEFIETEGVLSGVKFQRSKSEGEGRQAKLSPIPNSDFIIECDMAIKALGQAPFAQFLTKIEGLKFENGKVVIDPETGSTSIAGLYAGGDCISKGAEIVNAVQEGKIAARAIDEYLNRQK